MRGFCNMWYVFAWVLYCVECVCLYAWFYSMWVCVCVGFVMCGRLCAFVGFIICGFVYAWVL